MKHAENVTEGMTNDPNTNRPNDPIARSERGMAQLARELLPKSEADAEDTEGDAFDVAPAEDIPSARRLLREEDEPKQQGYAPHELERRQVSLGGLMVIVTAISVMLAPISFLPITVYTAVLGGLLLLLFIISALMGANELIVRVTLWSLLAVYLITLFIACKDQMGF